MTDEIRDLLNRTIKAAQALQEVAELRPIGSPVRARLHGKIEGVNLVRSYIEEAIRLLATPAPEAAAREHLSLDVYEMPDESAEALLSRIEDGTAVLAMRVCSGCAPEHVIEAIEDGTLDLSDGDALDAQWPCSGAPAPTTPTTVQADRDADLRARVAALAERLTKPATKLQAISMDPSVRIRQAIGAEIRALLANLTTTKENAMTTFADRRTNAHDCLTATACCSGCETHDGCSCPVTLRHTLTRKGRYGGTGDHHFTVDYGLGFIVQHYLSDREWQEIGSPDQITITVEASR